MDGRRRSECMDAIMNVDTMKAGPQIDALAEERIMGRPGEFVDRVFVNDQWHDVTTWVQSHENPNDPPAGFRIGKVPPRYSTSNFFMWSLATKLNVDGYDVVIELSGDGIVDVIIGWFDEVAGWSHQKKSRGNLADLPFVFVCTALDAVACHEC